MSSFATPVLSQSSPSVDFAIGARVRVAGYGEGTFQGASYTLVPGTLEIDELVAEVRLPSGKRVFVCVAEVVEA